MPRKPTVYKNAPAFCQPDPTQARMLVLVGRHIRCASRPPNVRVMYLPIQRAPTRESIWLSITTKDQRPHATLTGLHHRERWMRPVNMLGKVENSQLRMSVL